MTVHRTNRGVAAVVLAVLAFAWAQAPGTAAAAGCANEAIRAEQGPAALALPECRAYELVSPGGTPLVSGLTGGAAVRLLGAKAADDGNAMAYFSYYPFEGSPSAGFFFRARRGATGWSLEAMSPQVVPGAAVGIAGLCEATELNYSEDLSASVLQIGRDIKEDIPGASFCPQPQEEIVSGEPRGFANLLRRAAPDAAYELLNLPLSGAAPANAQFQDASDDLSHIVFGEEAALTPEAPPGYNLYLWVGGALRLVTFLPTGTPVRGDLAGATLHHIEGTVTSPGGHAVGGTDPGTGPITNAVSSNGERVFFYAEGNLYLRENAGQPPTVAGRCSEEERGRACTLQVDASRGPGNSGGGVFQYASADGSRVFFTDESRLTNSSSAAAGKPGLYEYQVEPRVITDRSPGGSEAADVRGFSGAAEDGSRLYFVAKGALTGAQQNAEGEAAQPEQPNLYLLEEGTLTFVATLDPSSDRSAWSYEFSPGPDGVPTGGGNGANLATRTSPDGRYFAFNSVRGLTSGPTGTPQIFLYDSATGSLTCASCLPGGTGPGQSTIPGPIKTTALEASAYLPRGLTDNGQLFFTTAEALLPADTNQAADVYEYHQGQLHLISDGAGAGPSFFFDASLGGGDVFFATTDPLVRSDTDNGLTLYDARIGGGFAEPPATAPPCAVGESCRGAGSGAPPTGTPTTPTHAGPGNVVPCKRGKVRRKGRCVTKRCKRGKVRRKGRCVTKRCKRGKVRSKGRCVKKGKHREHKTHRRTGNHRIDKRGLADDRSD